MSTFAVLAQTEPANSSSAAAAVFGVVVLIGLLSILALTSWGRRSLMPLVAVLLGLLVGVTTIFDAMEARVSALTVLGLFFSLLLVVGGLGALREGIALPQVEGTEPTIEPQPPRITPED